MSRIGKQPIQVPSGVKVSVSGGVVTVEGSKAKLSYACREEVGVSWDEGKRLITVESRARADDPRFGSAIWGTTRANLNNMVKGVVKPYEKTLEINGVGYTAEVKGKQLKLMLGFANAIMVDIPEGVTVTVDKQTVVKVSGADRQKVGQFAAEVRSKRKPEPYNAKGIKYSTETIRRKQGKQFGS